MKFTIRDWFWLTLLIGLVLFWWTDRQSLVKRHKMDLESQRIQHNVGNQIAKEAIKEVAESWMENLTGGP